MTITKAETDVCITNTLTKHLCMHVHTHTHTHTHTVTYRFFQIDMYFYHLFLSHTHRSLASPWQWWHWRWPNRVFIIPWLYSHLFLCHSGYTPALCNPYVHHSNSFRSFKETLTEGHFPSLWRPEGSCYENSLDMSIQLTSSLTMLMTFETERYPIHALSSLKNKCFKLSSLFVK